MDVKAKALFKSIYFSEYWSYINTADKYPKLRAEAKPFLFALLTSYMVEGSFSFVNATFTKRGTD